MNAAPTPVYNYAYTAWVGRLDQALVFIGEIEAHNSLNARARIRALHRTLRLKVPRTIQLAFPQYLRLSTDAPLRPRLPPQFKTSGRYRRRVSHPRFVSCSRRFSALTEGPAGPMVRTFKRVVTL